MDIHIQFKARLDNIHVVLFCYVWRIYQISKSLINPISGYENLSSCSWENRGQLIAENDFLSFFKIQWLHFTG